MHWLERRLGERLIAIGVVHTLFGLTVYDRSLPRELWRGGLLNSVGANGPRAEWLWFTTGGGLMIGTGLLARSHLRRTGTLPAAFGAGLLATALANGALQPHSGIWLVVAESIIALRLARRRPIGAGTVVASAR